MNLRILFMSILLTISMVSETSSAEPIPVSGPSNVKGCYETYELQLNECKESDQDEDQFINCIVAATDFLSLCLKLNRDTAESYCLWHGSPFGNGYLGAEKQCQESCGVNPGNPAYACMQKCMGEHIDANNQCMNGIINPEAKAPVTEQTRTAEERISSNSEQSADGSFVAILSCTYECTMTCRDKSIRSSIYPGVISGEQCLAPTSPDTVTITKQLVRECGPYNWDNARMECFTMANRLPY